MWEREIKKWDEKHPTIARTGLGPVTDRIRDGCSTNGATLPQHEDYKQKKRFQSIEN